MEQMKETWMETKENAKALWKNDFCVTGKECFLAGMCLLLLGIIIGLVASPATKGVEIAVGSHNSGNGSGNGSNNGNYGEKEKNDR